MSKEILKDIPSDILNDIPNDMSNDILMEFSNNQLKVMLVKCMNYNIKLSDKFDLMLSNNDVLSKKVDACELEIKTLKSEDKSNKTMIKDLTKYITYVESECSKLIEEYNSCVYHFDYIKNYIDDTNSYKSRIATELFMTNDAHSRHVVKFNKLARYINVNRYDTMIFIINNYIKYDCCAERHFKADYLQYSSFVKNVFIYMKEYINNIYITPDNTYTSFSYEYILLWTTIYSRTSARKDVYIMGLRLLKQYGINLNMKYNIFEPELKSNPDRISLTIFELLDRWLAYYSNAELKIVDFIYRINFLSQIKNILLE